MSPRRVLAAMSGGVDSSVAAACLLAGGHHVVGVTLKLWGGESDSGCCSVAEVDDARRVCQQLGIDHHVFGFGELFERTVVGPYVAAHAAGRTPNPCIECNRHVKLAALVERAEQLGFDAVATGHHARLGRARSGRWELRRGADRAKDQSYVVAVAGQSTLARVRFPIGSLTKGEVRAEAARLGLRTAAKPDSQDVCFVARAPGGRERFLGSRIPLRPGRVVDLDGTVVGEVPAVELVTVGQRKGLGGAGGAGVERRYVVDVDVASATVTIGPESDLRRDRVALESVTWIDAPVAGPVLAQTSAHGPARPATFTGDAIVWHEPQRRVAPGQAVVLYDPGDPDLVLAGAIAAARG